VWDLTLRRPAESGRASGIPTDGWAWQSLNTKDTKGYREVTENRNCCGLSSGAPRRAYTSLQFFVVFPFYFVPFVLRLLLDCTPVPTPRARLTARESVASFGSMPNILIVDDEPAIRRALSRLLTARGFAVVEAGSAADGIAAVGAGEIDAILCDVVMPGGSGFTFYDQLRALRPDLVRRVIFLTAAAKEPEVQEQTEARGAPLLSKLYELELAVDAVTVALLHKE
jgi:CheY-like chemotaxis protein